MTQETLSVLQSAYLDDSLIFLSHKRSSVFLNEISIFDIFQQITGLFNNELKDITNKARSFDNKIDYKEFKDKHVPYIMLSLCPSILYKGKTPFWLKAKSTMFRRHQSAFLMSQYLGFETDLLVENDSLEACFERIKSHPNVFFCHKSLSGRGYHFFMKHKPITDWQEYRTLWLDVCSDLETNLNLKLDKAVSNPNSAFFLAYDENAYFDPSKPLLFSKPPIKIIEEPVVIAIEPITEHNKASVSLVESCLKALPRIERDLNNSSDVNPITMKTKNGDKIFNFTVGDWWRRICMAVFNSVGSCGIDLLKQNLGEWESGEYERFYKSYIASKNKRGRPLSVATLVMLANSNEIPWKYHGKKPLFTQAKSNSEPPKHKDKKVRDAIHAWLDAFLTEERFNICYRKRDLLALLGNENVSAKLFNFHLHGHPLCGSVNSGFTITENFSKTYYDFEDKCMTTDTRPYTCFLFKKITIKKLK